MTDDDAPITFGEFVRWLRTDWRACIRLAVLLVVPLVVLTACVVVVVT